jgi:hypothetical protein
MKKKDEDVCFDVREIGEHIAPGLFKLNKFEEDADYRDKLTDRPVWSIGKSKKTGEIFAALDVRFYENSYYECLWLR